ncbi:hypothetical protein [Escherichia coli]|uniref:hypothetical protein n=1 Tax=Escherichia coli TaxID=562 RepID=UPI000D908D51|nr:hypothetical protein [Escherichia coli]SQC99339.1 Uncharacterised protein [Escherichia coli]
MGDVIDFGVMPGQTGSNKKKEGSREGEDALREFLTWYTPVTLSVFTQRNVVADYCPVEMTAGILMLT